MILLFKGGFFDFQRRVCHQGNLDSRTEWIAAYPFGIERSFTVSKSVQNLVPSMITHLLSPNQNPTIVPSLHEDFRVVFNKVSCCSAHFTVVTKEFKSQNTPLSPSELVVTMELLKNLKENDKEKKWFAFYNCGPQSGALNHISTSSL